MIFRRIACVPQCPGARECEGRASCPYARMFEPLAERAEFGVLAAKIRDRLSTLRECYDDGPLAIDFREFGERAARVRMTRCEIGRVEVARRSSRTGQTHPIGGFVGEAEYEGELAEFVPYLNAAKW